MVSNRKLVTLDRGAANGRNLSAFTLRRLYRIQTHNTSAVPRGGRVIFAATNVAAFDPFALFAAAPRPIHFLLPQELFTPPFTNALELTGQIPLVSDTADRDAMTAAIDQLTSEHAVGIFPEPGSGDGSFASIRHGIAYLQSRTNAPIVPVAIFGTRPQSDNLNDFPRIRSRIRVYFGNPFTVPPVGDIDYRATLASIGETIRQRLADHVVAASTQLTAHPVTTQRTL